MNGFVRVAALAGSALASAVAGRAAGQDIEFRVNQRDVPLGYVLLPPTIGLVYGGSGVGGNVMDAMAFSWPDDTIGAVAIPFCGRQCGGFLIDEGFGGGKSGDTRLFLRRFGPTGGLIDATDQVVTVATRQVHGNLIDPSLALRKINAGVGRANPFRLVWWDMWSWLIPNPPCVRDCDHHPVGWWTLGYADFLLPVPSAGSADFTMPALCHASTPSAAYGAFSEIVAWRDVLSPCRSILAGLGGEYHRPPHPLAIQVQPPEDGKDYDLPCAAGAVNESFVVAWRVDDLATFQSSIALRRVRSDGTLGPIVEVASPGNASGRAGPVVSMFDDGSFVVQWVGFINGDPPQTPLLAQVYDDSDPPAAVGGQIEVERHFAELRNHTVTVRGASWNPPPGQVSVVATVFENGNNVFPNQVVGQRIDALSGVLGQRVRVPLVDEDAPINSIGRAHQHTALVRSDERVAVAWRRGNDGNVYATVRTLPPPVLAPCLADYNASGGLDGDDLADYIADFFDSIGIQPGFGGPIAIPGGFAGTATLPFVGFGIPCPGAPAVPQPNPWGAPADAYEVGGYKVNVGVNNGPCAFPNGDDLADYIGIFFGGCP